MEEEANQPAVVDQNQADAPAAPALAAENETTVPLLMQGRIPLPKQLPVTGSLAQHWREWKQIWTSYEILSNLQVRDNKYRIATFITCIGADALRIYNSLPFALTTRTSLKVLAAMEKYCLGETNVIYERFVFNQRAQQEGETFDQFLTALKELAKTCNFAAMHDELVRDRIVVGVKDYSVRKLLLQKKNLTLQECADMCRASESTNEQMKVMTAKDTVHALQAQAQRKKKAAESGRQERAKASGKPQECKYCGTSHHKGARYCKAYGKQCQACGKMNHYTRMCKSKPLDKTNSTRKMSRLHTMKHEDDYRSENETYSSDVSHNEYALTLTLSLVHNKTPTLS